MAQTWAPFKVCCSAQTLKLFRAWDRWIFRLCEADRGLHCVKHTYVLRVSNCNLWTSWTCYASFWSGMDFETVHVLSKQRVAVFGGIPDSSCHNLSCFTLQTDRGVWAMFESTIALRYVSRNGESVNLSHNRSTAAYSAQIAFTSNIEFHGQRDSDALLCWAQAVSVWRGCPPRIVATSSDTHRIKRVYEYRLFEQVSHYAYAKMWNQMLINHCVEAYKDKIDCYGHCPVINRFYIESGCVEIRNWNDT